jgi:hypothetical protein
MRIGGTRGVSVGLRGTSGATRGYRVEPTATTEASGDRPASAQGRALVPVEQKPAAETPVERLARHRVHAPFLAQLLATRDGVPDTRRLRRAEPLHAARAYGAAMSEPGLLVPGYLVDAEL